ncbi:MAG: endolytic transglycosylase MltG [Deltaproteobacteria bacterium]|nr:endolytic transglycosylase MltG [Deltaproteobacteria bacterium]
MRIRHLGILLAAVGLSLILLMLHIEKYLDTPVELRSEAVFFDLKKGTSFDRLAHQLNELGLIASPWKLKTYALITGKARRLQAGYYLLHPRSTPRVLLDKFVKGEVYLARVVFPEGATVRDMACTLDQASIVGKQAFLETALADHAPARFNVPGPTLEGYLFPDTYLFRPHSSSSEVLLRMVHRWKQVFAPFGTRLKETGVSAREAMTMASIIEKETSLESERGLVASVFQNRLQKQMKLQSDPTVIYGVPDFDGNLTRKHLDTDTPYNTYTRVGLPAGPIANPGESSIRAALYPPNTSYFYFVSTNEGFHRFSETLSEHNRFVRLYQKNNR